MENVSFRKNSSHYITKQDRDQSANPAPEGAGLKHIKGLFRESAQVSAGWASTHTRRSMMKAPVMSLLQTPLRLFVPNFTTGTNSSYI